MLGSALLSALHVLALAIGLPGVFLRGRGLRAMKTDAGAVSRVLAADGAWGAAALLWLATGLLRAFAGFEKGTQFYLHSPLFHLKLTLFVLVVLLELYPMLTFIRWRVARAKKQPVDASKRATLTRLNDLEFALTLCIPFVAAMMARGIWFR